MGAIGRMNGVYAFAVRRPLPTTGSRTASDAELIRGARRGSQDDASRLFERYWQAAWQAALAITRDRAIADDVAQDAFERAFGALRRFDESRPFGPWLHRIVVNRALDVVRSRQRLVDIEAVPEPQSVDAQPDEGGPALEALQLLDPDRRAVVVLRHLLGYTPPQIAGILGVPVGTVHSRLSRGVAELRTALGDRDD